MVFASVMLGKPINPADMTLGFLVAVSVFMAQRSRIAATPESNAEKVVGAIR